MQNCWRLALIATASFEDCVSVADDTRLFQHWQSPDMAEEIVWQQVWLHDSREVQ